MLLGLIVIKTLREFKSGYNVTEHKQHNIDIWLDRLK